MNTVSGISGKHMYTTFDSTAVIRIITGEDGFTWQTEIKELLTSWIVMGLQQQKYPEQQEERKRLLQTPY